MPDRTMSPEGVLFEETQRLSGTVWVLVMVGTAGMLAAIAALVHESAPLRPQAFIGLGVAALVMGAVLSSRVVTRVTTAGAEVRFAPFPFGTVRLAPGDIAEVAPRTFGLFDGGIGYHLGWKWVAITARTGTGVQVTRPDGKRILIGTQRQEALLSALRDLQRRAAL